MVVLVFGIRGMLGSDIFLQLQKKGLSPIGYTSSDCDILDFSAVSSVFSQFSHIDVVINCAAYTRVDDAESHQKDAHRLNADAVKYLAQLTEDKQALFVHFSTDYVFDGSLDQPYKEDYSCVPINEYGRSKRMGEEHCMNELSRYYLFRVQWLYGVNGSNFVKTIYRLCKERGSLSIVNDQWGTPTYTVSLARYVVACILEQPAYGIYHCSDEGYTTWFDFAKAIVQELGMDTKVLPLNSSEFKRPAKRPLNGRLDCSKFDSSVKIVRVNWKDSLKLYLRKEYKKVVT